MGEDAHATASRLYATRDANFNVTGVVNTSAAVQEYVVYSAYGTAEFKNH